MNTSNSVTQSEGLPAARFLMVLGSFSPLFILWAIRGGSSDLIPEKYFIAGCVLLVIIPNLVLGLRIHVSKHNEDKVELQAGAVENHCDRILAYLLAMLLPFYSEDTGTWRDLSATAVALGFIIFLFWHLNMHYMNLLFALRGYRIFTVYPPDDGNPLAYRGCQILMTKRASIAVGEKIIAYRISNSVYMEIVR